MPIKYMDINDFINSGYLQEVNRQFFHPRGMALVVKADADDETGEVTGPWELAGIWDAQDDPEGIRFANETLDIAKASYVAKADAARQEARQAALGYWVQPI